MYGGLSVTQRVHITRVYLVSAPEASCVPSRCVSSRGIQQKKNCVSQERRAVQRERERERERRDLNIN